MLGEQEARDRAAGLAGEEEPVLPLRPGVLAMAWRFVRHKPLGTFGLFIVIIMMAMTVGTPKVTLNAFPPGLAGQPLILRFSPWDYQPERTFRDADTGRIAAFLGPSFDHPLGTDGAGRDNWARIVWGARRSLSVGLGALIMATALGTFIGLVSAYFRGWLDTLVQRFMDAIQSFPALLILLLAVSLTEPSLRALAVALGFVGLTSVQRIVRAAVLVTREEPYVEAARALGANDARIMLSHVLPNVVAPIIVVFSIGLGAVILAEAALAFIVPESVPQGPSWGLMLNNGRFFMFDSPWTALFSGAAIALAVTGFNLAGDAIRDVLDPRLRLA